MYNRYAQISTQDHYKNVKGIYNSLWCLSIAIYSITITSLIVLGLFVYFSVAFGSQKPILVKIEKQANKVLTLLTTVLNNTNGLVQDINVEYSRAKMAHKKSIGAITDEEYNQFLEDNGMNQSVDHENATHGARQEKKSYIAHFMNILLKTIPLDNEEEMVFKFKNFFTGIDSLMNIITVANQTRFIQNTTLIEKKINDALYSSRLNQMTDQGADIVLNLMTTHHEVASLVSQLHTVSSEIVNKINKISNSPLFDEMLRDKEKIISKITGLTDMLENILSTINVFVHSEEGTEDAHHIKEMLKDIDEFHVIQSISEILNMLVHLSGRISNTKLNE